MNISDYFLIEHMRKYGEVVEREETEERDLDTVRIQIDFDSTNTDSTNIDSSNTDVDNEEISNIERTGNLETQKIHIPKI